MASEWEMAMGGGVDLGMGMSTYHHHHNASSAAAIAAAPTMMSHHHHHHGAVGGGYSASAAAAHHHHYYGMPPPAMGDAMRVDELLDLSNTPGAHDFFPASAAAAGDNNNGHHHHHHHVSAMGGEPSGTTSSDHQTSMLSFADDFYIPTEEAAELEWLSKFVDDSYSDMPNYHSSAHAAMAAAAAAANNAGGSSAGGQDSCLTAAAPGRGARSKRSRATAAAAAAWHSLVPRPASNSSPSSSSCSSSDFPSSNKDAAAAARPRGSGKKSPGPAAAAAEVGMEGGVRRCTHCASEKTPQWRTGPLGPKTLCNACGVRFKSGRLMPEYRPAASPTFVLTQHSNSHRKVMELRRQKELIVIRGSHRDAASAAHAAAAGGRPELMFRDYGVC
uniref:GATA-type domain-containing protein n=1 Tax=Leersia perrieri TaxID=77586 RepID=A0A0D9XMB9_9ORYZ